MTVDAGIVVLKVSVPNCVVTRVEAGKVYTTVTAGCVLVSTWVVTIVDGGMVVR